MKISDHTEFAGKPKPLTTGPETMVADAVDAMAEKNYGSIAIVRDDERLLGIVTERDVMNRLVRRKLDPAKTPVREIMSKDLRVAHQDDDVLDWLRIMSNERFRRLPVVDDQKRVKAIMTQGDFVAYTWPELFAQARQLTKATLSTNTQLTALGLGLLAYTAIVVAFVSAV